MNVTVEYDHIGRGAKVRVDAVKHKVESPSKKKKLALLEDFQNYAQTQNQGFILRQGGEAAGNIQAVERNFLPKQFRGIETYINYVKAFEEMLENVASNFAKLHIRKKDDQDFMV